MLLVGQQEGHSACDKLWSNNPKSSLLEDLA